MLKTKLINSTRSINDDDSSKIDVPIGAYEIESLNYEIKRNFFEQANFTETNCPFEIRLNFSTLGSFMEISSDITGSQIDISPDDSIRDLLGFKPVIIHEDYNLSHYPFDIVTFDNIFLETEIAQGIIFKDKRTGIFPNFTMNVDPGFNYTENFRGGIQWYMMSGNDFISNFSFKSKNENELVSFIGQSVTFRL